MFMNPLVSIIMPVYNTGELLRQTIGSILNQTYDDWELVVVDDGSTDECTIKICDEFRTSDFRIKVFHKTNGGICDARNFGLSKASGRYVAFCDHDDEYAGCLLEKALPYILRGVDILHFSYRSVYHNSGKELLFKATDHIRFVINTSDSFLSLVKNHFFETIWSSIYNRTLLEDSSMMFDTAYKFGGEDFDFNIRIFPHASKIMLLPDILYTHYYRDTSTSSNLRDDILWNFVVKQKKINSVIKTLQIDLSQNVEDYVKYSAEIMVSMLSYGVRMKKSYDEMKKLMYALDSQILAKPTVPLILYDRNVKEAFTLLLLWVLTKHLYGLPYVFFCCINKFRKK